MSRIKDPNSSGILDRYSITSISLLVVLVVGIILITVIFTYLCFLDIKQNEENFYNDTDARATLIANSFILYNKAFYRYDLFYDNMSQNILTDYRKIFERAGGNPDSVDLEEIKRDLLTKYYQSLNLYIIDQENTLVKSTEPGATRYNFLLSPSIRTKLANIRLQNNTEVDPLLKSNYSDISVKWGYIPTADHKYLLATILLINNVYENDNIYKFGEVNRSTENSLATVHLFTHDAITKDDPLTGIVEYGSSTDKLSDIHSRLDNINRSFSEKETFSLDFPEENQRVYYIYVNSSEQDTTSGLLPDKVIEITYNTALLNKTQYGTIQLYIGIIILSLLLFLIFGVIIIRYVIRPVHRMIDNIEIIAGGDYSHKIPDNDEFIFQRLSHSIEKMTDRLNKEIEDNQKKAEELTCELKERFIIEKALNMTSKKLKLLSSITRHDILNQVAIVTGSIEITLDNLGNNHKEIPSLQRANAAANKIQNQILFTKIYDELGASEPFWQNLSTIVLKISNDLKYQPGIIQKNYPDNLCILADSMLDRVIYNLLDNALHHATKMKKLKISFEELLTGDGLLFFSDDGPGVPDNIKEVIFTKDFGDKSGFGLFLIRENLSITDIRISEIGKYGEGATFKLEIPGNCWKYKTGCAN